MAMSYGGQVEAIPLVEEALMRALELAGDKSLVLITGSIFVAATARIAWFEFDQGQAF
jgi:folylpolyglutamate synthase/dihydropteroate synthase